MSHVLKTARVPLALVIILVFLALSQTRCTVVRYYKVSDVRKGFKNTQTKTERNLKKMTRDVQRHRSVLTSARTRGVANRTPFPELKRLVGSMGKIRDQLVYKQQDIEKLRVRFERIVGPRRIKVQSNEADYPRVRKVMDELKILHRDMKALVKRYDKKRKAFQKLIKTHKIRTGHRSR